jgi:hypothetical protein
LIPINQLGVNQGQLESQISRVGNGTKSSKKRMKKEKKESKEEENSVVLIQNAEDKGNTLAMESLDQYFEKTKTNSKLDIKFEVNESSQIVENRKFKVLEMKEI